MANRKSVKTANYQPFSAIFPLPQETLILLVVSALDVVMTHALLTRGDGGFIESNPVARYFLDRWGMEGMAYFKAAMTLVVCVITQIVARQNELLARRVLEVATLIIAAVVIYSVSLHFRHHDLRPVMEFETSNPVPMITVQG